MTNEEVLGALKSALEHGDSMSRAVKTLRNARYKKEDIEEAMSILSEFPVQSAQQKNNFPKFMPSKTPEVPLAPAPVVETPKQKKKLFQKLPQNEKQTQKVSGYDDKKIKKKSKLIPALIFILFFIAIAITVVFFFWKEISYFVANLFK